MKMELKFTKEEVKGIIVEHVKTMLPGYIEERDVDVSFTTYGNEAEVTITEKEPEPEEKKDTFDDEPEPPF